MRGASVSVTVADVDRIVAVDDPVLRNLQITVAYGRMAADFAELVDRENLSWCGFGTWASEGVGASIRHHQTDQSIVLRAMRVIRRRGYPEIARTAAAAFADGNRSVFDHIGRGFAGFHEAITATEPGAMDRFFADLPGPERPRAGTTVDVAFHPDVGLADGFAAYREVLVTPAADAAGRSRRAQLVCLGNLCLAHVEQVRLQGPIEDAFSSVLGRCLAGRRAARAAAARLVTETILELRLGPEEFRPGRPMPDLDGRRFPADLVDLDPASFERFAEVVVPATARQAPDADDWTSLRDRLRYIGALMRSRQQAPALLGEMPFTEAEREQIEAGTVPDRLAARDPG